MAITAKMVIELEKLSPKEVLDVFARLLRPTNPNAKAMMDYGAVIELSQVAASGRLQWLCRKKKIGWDMVSAQGYIEEDGVYRVFKYTYE